MSFSRVQVVMVELVLDSCDLVYGTSPCTAAVGTTGPDRCYNTFKTCQDRTNYDRGTKTYRFIKADAPNVFGVQGYRQLKDVRTTPGRIDRSKGLASFTTTMVEVAEFQDEDVGVDPYLSRRGRRFRAPFFARLLQRNPHYKGRKLVVREGTLERDGTFILSAADTRTYVIESINSDGGIAKIVGTDGSKRLRGLGRGKFKIPQPTDVELAAEMDATQTTATVKSGQGDTLGPTPFYIRVDDEIMLVQGRSNDSLSSINRNQWGTVEDTHDEDAKVQLCKRLQGRVDAIWNEVCTDAGYEASEIDTAGATAEVDREQENTIYDYLASEPTEGDKIMEQLMSSANARTWWDPKDAQQKLAVIRPRHTNETAKAVSDSVNIVAGSVDVKVLEDRQLTRATIYYQPKDWSLDLSKRASYSRVAQYINAVEEGGDAFGESLDLEVFAPFADDALRTEMVSRVFRIVSRNVRAPKRVKIRVASTDGTELPLYADVDLTTWRLVDDSGAEDTKETRVVRTRRLKSGGEVFEIELETTQFDTGRGTWAEWASDPGVDSQAQWADANGETSSGVPGMVWT